MKLTIIAIAAALVAGCAVKGDEASFLVASKLIQANGATGGTGGGATCAYDPTSQENVFGVFNPAAGYVHALVVTNNLPDNSGVAPGRLNTNGFQVEGATVHTEIALGPAQNVADQTVLANGFIPTGGILPVQVVLAQPGAIQPGSDVRFHVQVFGRLQDGSRVKTNTYEYAASTASSFPNPCATGTTPTFCETGAKDVNGAADVHTATQDTGAVCQ